QSPGGGQACRANCRRIDRGRVAEFLEFAAAQGSGDAQRLRLRGAYAARRRHRLVEIRARAAHRDHGRRIGPRGAGAGDRRRLCATVCARHRNYCRRRGGSVFPAATPASRQRGRRMIRWRVAVYTDVGVEDLQTFLAGYELGDVLSYKGIAEGVENSNFLLHTTRGYFVLTLYEKRVAARDLPFFLGLMEHLHGRGLTCPQPVRDRS